MKSTLKRILFLQLPQKDNDVKGPAENEKLASVYLRYSIQRAGLNKYFTSITPDPNIDNLDNKHLAEFILKSRPDIIAATLYLWNIERTIRILSAVKRALPSVTIIAGGPEIARNHPFLFKSRIVDIAVTGEGEPVFPAIVKAILGRKRTNYSNVAWRTGNSLKWGSNPPPVESLINILPPPGHKSNRPDKNGIAYIESTRGCPMNCAFCCYNQRRKTVGFLPSENVVERVKILGKRGAKEIRFIDPTFNSHPEFDNLIRMLAKINCSIPFFAELRPDTVTAKQARLLAKAGYRNIEAGIQSTNPKVLTLISRNVKLPAALTGIKLLSKHGIRLTLDIMCGLPGQTLQDVKSSLIAMLKIKNANVQFLHTLLLPGTSLRDNSKHFGLKSLSLPPYRVTATRYMNKEDLAGVDEIASKLTGRDMDNRTSRFVGFHLPDLFEEKISISISNGRIPVIIPGRQNRRAIIIKGCNIFGKSGMVEKIIETAIRTEPDNLWQFVLNPETEEPLDLIDRLTKTIDHFPKHVLDRSISNSQRTARRVLILLNHKRKYDSSWVRAAADLLSSLFY